jgi:hypothetical protein
VPGLRRLARDDHQQDRERGDVLAMRLVRRSVERREARARDDTLTDGIPISRRKPTPQPLIDNGIETAHRASDNTRHSLLAG